MTPVFVLFRFVGYGLLLLTVFDVISAVVPPQLSNPAWQFTTAGGLVEKSVIPLIGFLFVFFENNESRKKGAALTLKLLSWIALLIGVAYIAMILVFFTTPQSLNDTSQKQVAAQFEPNIKKAQQLSAAMAKASPAEITTFMTNNRVPAGTDVETFRKKMIADASTAEKNLTTQASMTNGAQRLSLIKNAVKWGLGALISGILFIRIWAGTAWARR
jgi:hypothetical protein